MKTLANETDRTDLLRRLQQLTPNRQRRCHKMSPHQMVCHLTDSFKALTGEKPVSSKSNLVSRTAVRWIASYPPLRWPHGVPMRPEMDQNQGGTQPVEFIRDVNDLELMIERRSSAPRDFQWHRHPCSMKCQNVIGYAGVTCTQIIICDSLVCELHERNFKN